MIHHYPYTSLFIWLVFILSYFDGQCKPLTDVIEKADLVFYFAFVGLYVVRNKPKM